MALFKPYPVVRFGSMGEAVLLLQKALNLGPTQLSRLAEDASLGPKTHGRVVEFQGQKNAARDGVVGPVTWGELEPFVQQVLKMVDQNLGPSADEETQRQRIVDVAQASFENWGWGTAGAVTPDGSARIAAARGVGPWVNGSIRSTATSATRRKPRCLRGTASSPSVSICGRHWPPEPASFSVRNSTP